MSLYVKYRGHGDSLDTLKASDFTRQNYGAVGMTSSRITVATPNGVLGGMVARQYAAGVNCICSGAHIPIGVYLTNSSDASFENTPAVASGKVAVMKSMGVYETDIYETFDEATGLVPLVYAVDDKLYPSKNGLLTKDSGTNANQVGVFRYLLANGNMVFDLRI